MDALSPKHGRAKLPTGVTYLIYQGAVSLINAQLLLSVASGEKRGTEYKFAQKG